MKKIIAIMLILIFCMIPAGCGSSDVKTDESQPVSDEKADAVREEVVNLVNNEFPAISEKRDSAVQVFNDFFSEGDSADRDVWGPKLTDAVNEYDQYLLRLKSIGTTTEEGTGLLSLYVGSAELQFKAMQDIADATNEMDSDKLNSARSSLAESHDMMDEYDRKLLEICNKYGILIN